MTDEEWNRKQFILRVEESMLHFRDQACTFCHGNGHDPSRVAYAPCRKCRGSGKLIQALYKYRSVRGNGPITSPSDLLDWEKTYFKEWMKVELSEIESRALAESHPKGPPLKEFGTVSGRMGSKNPNIVVGTVNTSTLKVTDEIRGSDLYVMDADHVLQLVCETKPEQK